MPTLHFTTTCWHLASQIKAVKYDTFNTAYTEMHDMCMSNCGQFLQQILLLQLSKSISLLLLLQVIIIIIIII